MSARYFGVLSLDGPDPSGHPVIPVTRSDMRDLRTFHNSLVGHSIRSVPKIWINRLSPFIVGGMARSVFHRPRGTNATDSAVAPRPGNMSVFYLLLCFQDMLKILTLLMHAYMSAGLARSRCPALARKFAGPSLGAVVGSAVGLWLRRRLGRMVRVSFGANVLSPP